MVIRQFLESIDWPWLIGAVGFELVCLWLWWIERTPVLPDPEETCIACGEPPHHIQPIEWKVGAGHTRFP
jgi:hypothetical protein